MHVVHDCNFIKPSLLGYTLQGVGGRSVFYIPKGTKQIQYYWAGAEPSLFGPDEKLLRTVTESNDYLTVDVPKGLDGKLWSFSGRFDPRKFINVPGYIAPSREALLVPRDVGKKDWLKTRG